MFQSRLFKIILKDEPLTITDGTDPKTGNKSPLLKGLDIGDKGKKANFQAGMIFHVPTENNVFDFFIRGKQVSIQFEFDFKDDKIPDQGYACIIDCKLLDIMHPDKIVGMLINGFWTPFAEADDEGPARWCDGTQAGANNMRIRCIGNYVIVMIDNKFADQEFITDVGCINFMLMHH